MKDEKGFTLIELLVAMFVAGIVMAAVYSAYYSQQKSYTAQEQMAEMQQNLRAAMYMMAKEMRMAGCNPKGGADTAGFQTIENDFVRFTMDIRGQGATDEPDGTTGNDNEDITYSLADLDGDGQEDELVRNRNQGEGDELLAENIDALDFVYLDKDENETLDRLEVRSVQITLVARTGRGDPGFTNTTVYNNLQGDEVLSAQNDSFRRRMLSTHIRCRNMGLQ